MHLELRAWPFRYRRDVHCTSKPSPDHPAKRRCKTPRQSHDGAPPAGEGSTTMRDLKTLYHAWCRWSASADRAENGWESDFAGWAELMERAAEAMRDAPSDPGLLQAVEACWAISE